MTEDRLKGGSLSVIEGRDGWLFLDRFENTNVMDLYTDKTAFSAAICERWRQAMTSWRGYFDRVGIAAATLVVPDTCVVYPDKLPEGLALEAHSPFTRLAETLEDTVLAHCAYPRQILIDGRKVEETYQSVDSHWTDWGAYLGYRAVMEDLAPRVPGLQVLQEHEIHWSSRTTFGALGATTTPERSAQVPIAHVKDEQWRITENVMTEVRDGYMVTEQDRPDLPSVVIFRDSFMTSAFKFFSQSFRRAVYVGSPVPVLYDLIETEKPDVVIFEMAERRLVIPPLERSIYEFRAIFGDLMLGDDDAAAAQVASRSLMRSGDLEGALAANDEALALAPPNARLMLHRARLFSLLHRPDAALEALRAATALDPSDGATWYFAAQSLRQSGLAAEARLAAMQAVSAEPHYATFWPTAVTAILEAGDPADALELANDGLARHPDDLDLLYAQSRALAATGQLVEAERVTRQVIAARPTVAAYVSQLLSILLRREDWAPAHAALEKLVAMEPETPALAEFRAQITRNLSASASYDN
jgi:tetratricopeptide (TPR) repeat protein